MWLSGFKLLFVELSFPSFDGKENTLKENFELHIVRSKQFSTRFMEDDSKTIECNEFPRTPVM